MLMIADVIEALSKCRPNWGRAAISCAVVDSRNVKKNSMFVAVPGDQVDGHDYVSDAFDNGAVVALVQKELPKCYRVLDVNNITFDDLSASLEIPFCIKTESTIEALQQTARFWRARLNPRIIGITGSVGKSTTKEVSAEVLSQRYRTIKNPGNLNNEIGLPLSILRMTEEHQRGIFEMGFYVPGEIAFLCDIANPQVGVVTNIGTVHAERAGSIEAIAEGKSELVQALPSDPEGVAILNYDDPLVKNMANKTKARIFFYGIDPEADLWADNVEGLGLDGIRLRLHYRDEIHYMRVPLIGRHSVHTVLRAAALGLVEELSWQEIVDGLHSGKAQLRLVAVQSAEGALLLDDTYNASPESTLAALNLLDELGGNKIAVLGDMLELGKYEIEGHKMVGARAAEVVNELVTVGERAKIIAETAGKSGLDKKAITELGDSYQAIELLKNRLDENDVVLIKGSHGMRMDRIVSALEQSE
jgi:UDP-N-acetylmuramoyl-tripeptide--D-alanyl-D-alanine ligase